MTDPQRVPQREGGAPGRADNLDLMLHWKDDAPVLPAPRDDRFELRDEEALQEASFQVAGHAPAPVPEIFQWTEDRDRAIEAALRGMAEAPTARVHQQLVRIREALQTDRLDAARATALLDEVDAWLAGELRTRRARPAVADERIHAARSSVCDALHLFAEVSGVLRAYVASHSGADLVLATRLADQAGGFLLDAREALLRAAPPLEEAGPAVT